MGMNERLYLREVGYSRLTTGRHPKPLRGSGPLAFERSCNSSEDIIKRLTQTAKFTGDAACVSNVTWSPDGQFLAAGGEDCRITIWEPGTRQLKQTVDMVIIASESPAHQIVMKSTVPSASTPELYDAVPLKVCCDIRIVTIQCRVTPPTSIPFATCQAGAMSISSQPAMTRR